MTNVLALDDLRTSPTALLFEGRRHFGVELSIFITTPAPGGGPVLHVHPYAEVFIVQEGEATFTVGDEQVVVGAGHVVSAPAGTPHRFENTGDGPLQVVSVHPNGVVEQTGLDGH